MKAVQSMLWGAVLRLLLLQAGTVWAETIIKETPDGNGQAIGGFTTGISLKANANLVITKLGVQDFGSDGLADAHAVGLWTNGVLAASVTIPAGKTADLQGDWRYMALSKPVSISKGDAFVIAAMVTSNDMFHAKADPAISLAVNSAVSGLNGGPGVLQQYTASGEATGDGTYVTAGSLTQPNTAWYPNYWVNAEFTVGQKPAGK